MLSSSGRWKKIVACLAVGCGVSIVAWELLRSREPDPIYAGRRLSYWIENLGPAGSYGWDNRSKAVIQAGTNALPLLLRYMRAHDSPLKIDLRALIGKQNLIRCSLLSDEEQHFRAVTGFQALGPVAESAVPELMRIYGMNLSEESRSSVMVALGNIGPGAKAAVPLLMGAATNVSGQIRRDAIWCLESVGIDADLMVPLCIGCLKDSETKIKIYGVERLTELGTRAGAAVPALLELRKQMSPALASSGLTVDVVDRAVEAIDPVAAEKAGIRTTSEHVVQ